MTALEKLKKRLARIRFRTKAVHGAEKMALFISAIAAAVFVLPLLYAAPLRDDVVYRWLVSLSAAGLFCWLGYHWFLKPLWQCVFRRNTPSLEKSALQIGAAFPQIRDRLSNALQLMRDMPKMDEAASALAQKEFERVHQAVAGLALEKYISTDQLRRNTATAAGLLIVTLSLAFIFPNTYRDALRQLLTPYSRPAQAEYAFRVSPGDVRIVRGTSLEISASVADVQPRSMSLHVLYDGGFEETFSMQPVAGGPFRYTLENVQESGRYFLKSDGRSSESFQLDVVELPDIRQMQLRVRPPAYTKLPEMKPEPDVGLVSVLAGSEVFFSVLTNKPVREAKLLFSDHDPVVMKKSGEVLTGRVQIRSAQQYSVYLKDSAGLENANPILWQIDIIPDQRPVVEIVRPGRDQDLDESRRVPLLVSGEDDFGFTRLDLVYSVYRSGEQERSFRERLNYVSREATLQAEYLWDLQPAGLEPEDVVVYHVELFDNDMISGPKKASSREYRLRLPSLMEIFAEAGEQQERSLENLDELAQSTEEIREDVQEILQEFRRNPELDWEDKQALRDASGKQEKILNDMQTLGEQLDEMVDRMENNELLSPEILQKYQELQELIDEIATPEMREAMRKLQEAMEKLDPENIEKALEEFQQEQEQFARNLERTINLLKQLQAEQRLEESLRIAEEMVQKQEQINDKARSESSPEQQSALADEEMKQMKRLEQLQQALKSLQEKIAELPQIRLPREQVDAAQETAESQELMENLQEMTQALDRADQEQSAQTGQQLMQQMQQMQQNLAQAREQMQQNQQAELRQALQRGARDLLRLSRRQEALARKTAQSEATQFRDLADQQQDVLSALLRTGEKLLQKTQESFFMPGEAVQKLDAAATNMRSAIDQLGNRQGARSAGHQGKAMQGLNAAVAELRQAMRNMSGSGSGSSGMQDFFRRMMGISQAQEGINQQTQGLNNPGMMSMERQAALARLAARQEALRRAMQELQKQYGGRGDVLGDLGNIAREMQEVAQNLRQQKTGKQTIERQRRILSRLLDAQKSVQKREFSKKRRAETGKQYRALDPGRLPADLGERRSRLRQDLLRALKENYTRDYKKLIRSYFEALSREAQQEGTGAQ